MISQIEYEYLQELHELLSLILETQKPSDTVAMTGPETQLMVGTGEWVNRLCNLGEGKKWVPQRRLVWASEAMGPQMGVVQTNEALIDQMEIMKEAVKAATVKGPPVSAPFG